MCVCVCFRVCVRFIDILRVTQTIISEYYLCFLSLSLSCFRHSIFYTNTVFFSLLSVIHVFIITFYSSKRKKFVVAVTQKNIPNSRRTNERAHKFFYLRALPIPSVQTIVIYFEKMCVTIFFCHYVFCTRTFGIRSDLLTLSFKLKSLLHHHFAFTFLFRNISNTKQ